MFWRLLEEFEGRVRQIALKPPQVPYLTNVTGTWITAQNAQDPAYWVEQLCSPVRFAQGIETRFDEHVYRH